MGMTDKQFDSHIAGLVRELEDIRDEIEEKYQAKSEKLERILRDFKSQLKKP